MAARAHLLQMEEIRFSSEVAIRLLLSAVVVVGRTIKTLAQPRLARTLAVLQVVVEAAVVSQTRKLFRISSRAHSQQRRLLQVMGIKVEAIRI